MSSLNAKEIGALLEKFPHLNSSFDTSAIVNDFIFSSSKKLICLVCRKDFCSPFEILENSECKGENFHPKNCINVKNEKAVCPHEGCSRKFVKGEIACCHKASNSTGCTIGEGKHLIIISD